MENLDEFVEERVKQAEQERIEAEAYAKAKAEAETKELANIMQDPTKTLNTKLSQKLADAIDNSKVVDEKVGKTSEILVEQGLQAQENKAKASVINSEDETLKADFEKNKDEYLYHGINHKIDKKWKRNLIHVINDIWFVIWAIVSCFTIVPVSTFLSRIGALKGFMKGVGIVVGVVLLLACLTGLTFACLRWCGLW